MQRKELVQEPRLTSRLSVTDASLTERGDIDRVISELSGIPQIGFPQSKGEKTMLRNSLRTASVTNPLEIYVGSCPDYSHNGKIYTHRGIGGGIPLLTQFHLDEDVALLKVLDQFEIPYKYILMVADVEALDDVFCTKFTGGDRARFLDLCSSSIQQTAQRMQAIGMEQGLQGELLSGSFFSEFSMEKFMHYQTAYVQVLNERFQIDDSFRQRVVNDTYKRSELYRKMYDLIITTMEREEREGFLVGRTIRTMAQYLALGRLIKEKSQNPILIGHPTVNLRMFNDINRFRLRDDVGKDFSPIPIFEMRKSVY